MGNVGAGWGRIKSHIYAWNMAFDQHINKNGDYTLSAIPQGQRCNEKERLTFRNEVFYQKKLKVHYQHWIWSHLHNWNVDLKDSCPRNPVFSKSRCRTSESSAEDGSGFKREMRQHAAKSSTWVQTKGDTFVLSQADLLWLPGIIYCLVLYNLLVLI